MNEYIMLSSPLDQPWWRVRPQLVATLFGLALVCTALWTDNPVQLWVAREVVQAQLPPIPLFAQQSQ
jgi:hypothetical protein